MERKILPVELAPITLAPVLLEAEPEPLEVDLRRLAVIVIDMQNAFLTKGAYVDLLGRDIAARRVIIEPIKNICNIAREKGCKVIYVVTVHHPGDAGTGPDAVYWHKETSLVMYREHPEWKDKLLLPNTWGAKIIKELEPKGVDIIVEKPRYNAFIETNLDTILKRYNIKYLLTVGVTTNCCVESTIREAYYRGYFAILVSDATAAGGPAFMQEASVFNVKTFFGWVTDSKHVVKTMV